MSQGIGEMLTFAVGVAVSPVPIIAVILMLFSGRAKVNGPMFLLGWVVALSVISFAVYFAVDVSEPSTSTGANDAISWGKAAIGLLFLALAMRSWRRQPPPGEQPAMPKWTNAIDALAPGKALVLGFLLVGINPKNLLLTVGAAAALAQLGLTTSEAVTSLVIFVAVSSLTIGLPVTYYLVGGDSARATLSHTKSWLTLHNDAVMTVLFLVFGVKLIADAIPHIFA